MYSSYKDKLIRNWNISIFVIGLVLDASVYGSSSVFCLLASNMINDVRADEADGVFWRRINNVRMINLWLTHFAHQISFGQKECSTDLSPPSNIKIHTRVCSLLKWHFSFDGYFCRWLFFMSGVRISESALFFINFIIRLSLGLMEACFTLGSCPYQRHSNYHR